MTGTTVAQAIPIAASPILTRIYSPEDFGVFTIFIAVSSIFGSIANGRYELAIMLPKKDDDAINIFALGFIITVFLSSVLFILVFSFNNFFVELLKNKDIDNWLYFVPVTVFFTGLFNLLNYYSVRKKYYKSFAKSTILRSVAMVTVQLLVGYLYRGVSGLISGQLFSQFVVDLNLLKNILKDKILLSKISKVKILALAKRYKDFPKFSMWAILVNSLYQNITNILISTLYNTITLGFYSLAQRVLGIPFSLIGGSVGQVYFQEASKEVQLTGNARKSFNSTVKKLIFIGVPSFLILFLL